MTSQAIRDFCSAVRADDALRARRADDKRTALHARRAAEQLLIETLGEGTRAKVLVDDTPHLVAVRQRRSYPSFSSAVVDRLLTLWDDDAGLREKLEATECQDVCSALEAVLLEEAGPVKTSLSLHLAPLKQTVEVPEAPSSCNELCVALVHAREDILQGRDEHNDEHRRLVNQKKTAEASLVQELASLGQGKVKKVNMLDADGTSASFYLRLKQPRAPAKKKITRKTLQGIIKATLPPESGSIDAAMRRVCDPSFGEDFLAQLRQRLVDHETVQATAEPRVALDRIRASVQRRAANIATA